MYIPKKNEEMDLGVLHELIRAYPLGTWVTIGDEGLIANHIPFSVEASQGEFGTLVGHVSRANSVWKLCSKDIPSMVIFQGSNSYITPSWYASKVEHGKVVPTWNYIVVHVHGIPKIIDDKDWLLGQISRLTNELEHYRSNPWKVTDAPQEYIDHLCNAIVGVEIPIASLVGKWKLSQGKSDSDKRGVVDGLSSKNDFHAKNMADLIENNLNT